MHIIFSAALHQQLEFQYFEHTEAKMTDNISNIYWWMKIVVFQLKLYWNLFKYPMDYKSALVQVIHWRLFGDGAKTRDKYVSYEYFMNKVLLFS